MSFAVTGKENIVIYGAGQRGIKLAELFDEQGFYIRAILDRKRIEPLKLQRGGGNTCSKSRLVCSWFNG